MFFEMFLKRFIMLVGFIIFEENVPLISFSSMRMEI